MKSMYVRYAVMFTRVTNHLKNVHSAVFRVQSSLLEEGTAH